MEHYTKIITTVTITKEEYTRLLIPLERIAVLERFLAANEYVSIDDVKTILGIDVKKEDKNND